MNMNIQNSDGLVGRVRQAGRVKDLRTRSGYLPHLPHLPYLPTRRTLLLLAALVMAGAATHLSASDPGTGDWPMWGGTPDRNMVSNMKGLPTEWDVKTKKNVKWIASLGSQSYGNPIVAGGMVFVGTNNEGLRDPKQGGDRGVLMAFRESDGTFLWQHTHEKLSSGRANDWPYQGVASSPLVEGTRLYYTSNRGVVWCVDINGFADGNAGPATDETLTGEHDADVIWSFNMMEEVGSYPHNLSNSSPVSLGDLIYVSTSNGQDESHVNIPSPKAPAVIALNKTTGKLVWEDNSVGNKILHGQWSTPTVGKIGGVDQVVSAQGDGWVRGYEAATGKKLWEFDTNPKDAVWPKTRNELIATPVIYEDRVYIANGQDPEHGEGVGHFYCIDATKRGDITDSGRVWHYDKIRRSISTASIVDGIVYVPDFSGFLHCLDAKTGQVYWTHDLLAAVWASTLVVDGKVYIGDEDGDITVLQAGKEKKVLTEMNMGSAVYATPVPAHGALFLNNRNQLFALATTAGTK
jgi:outer membrane protein assembly factor BamB